MWNREKSIAKAALHAHLHLDISEILQITCPTFRMPAEAIDDDDEGHLDDLDGRFDC
jgi:hypothetical protein